MDALKVPSLVLRTFSGLPLWLLYCPDCKKPCGPKIEEHYQDPEARILACSSPDCSANWIICSPDCKTQRAHLRSPRAFNQHVTRCSSRKKAAREKGSNKAAKVQANPGFFRAQPSVDTTDLEKDTGEALIELSRQEELSEEVEDSVVLTKMQQLGMAFPPLFSKADLVKPDFSKFTGEANQKYFQYEARGKGAAYLVALSSFKNYDSSVKMDHREVELQLRLTKLVSSMTRGQKEDLGTVLGMVMDSAVRRSQTSDNAVDETFRFPVIPRSGEDIRRLYDDGRNSIMTNIPKAPARMLRKHAVVDIFDVVADFLGHGIPCRSIPSIPWFHSQIDLQNKKRKADGKAELLSVASIKEKYGPLLVRIRKRISDASIISHPDNPFHPTDYCVPKAVVMKKGNSLHRIGPCEREDDRLAVTRRELVGWPGLQVPEVTNDENGGLPEMLRYGERTIRDIDHSLIAQAIREEAILSKYPLPTLVIGFALWSDSCDPNRSMSKLNRGSIWALLLTLCCRVANINPFSYTYLIALGKDSENHDEVLEKTNKEITSFISNDKVAKKRTFYMKLVDSMVNVHLREMTSLADQPERRDLTDMLRGNGTFTGRWGFSANLEELWLVIVPCEACKKKMLEELFVKPYERVWDAEICDICTRWEIDEDSPLLCTPVNDKLYPKGAFKDEKIRPFRLHFGLMSKEIDKAHDHVVKGEWTKKQANNYLQVHAVNQTLRTKFWRAAQHNKHWSHYIDKIKTEETLKNELGPSVFNEIKQKGMIPIEKPATWDRAQPLALNIDVIMHLLFLGVWSTLISQGMDWLRLNQMESSFLLYSSGLLETIQSLNLSYCRVLGYKKGKLGGWVSENYLGFARVGNWFYSRFGCTKKKETYAQPERQQKYWNKKENEAWLAARRLPKKGKAKELSKKVADYMAQAGGQPPIVESGGGSRALFLEAVNGLLRLIAVVMQDFVNEELLLEMDYQAKVFLTLFEELDKNMRKPKDKPRAITTYNFFSLLNLPVAAGMLGPLRNVWEGGSMGEGYLQQIKAAVHGGLKTGWEMRVMNSIHKNNGLKNVLKAWNTDETLDEREDTFSYDVMPGKYFKYKSLAALVLCFEKGDPISAVQMKIGKFACVLGDDLALVEIKLCLEQEKEKINGWDYMHWEIDKERNMGRLDGRNYSNPVLLLPLLSNAGAAELGKEYMYAAVTDSWTRLTDSGTFVRY